MKQLLISIIILVSSLTSFSQGKLIEDTTTRTLRYNRSFVFTDGVSTIFIVPVFKYVSPIDKVDVIINTRYKHNGYYTLNGFKLVTSTNINRLPNNNSYRIEIRSQDSVIRIRNFNSEYTNIQTKDMINIVPIDAIRVTFTNSNFKVESLILDPNDRLYFVNLKQLLKENNILIVR